MATSGTRLGRIGPPLTDEERRRIKQAEADEDFFDAHYEKLAQEYPYRWVAIHNGEVVLVGTDIYEFGRMLRERGLVESGVRVRYLDPEPLPLIL